jgi:hypothetical protein
MSWNLASKRLKSEYSVVLVRFRIEIKRTLSVNVGLKENLSGFKGDFWRCFHRTSISFPIVYCRKESASNILLIELRWAKLRQKFRSDFVSDFR